MESVVRTAAILGSAPRKHLVSHWHPTGHEKQIADLLRWCNLCLLTDYARRDASKAGRLSSELAEGMGPGIPVEWFVAAQA